MGTVCFGELSFRLNLCASYRPGLIYNAFYQIFIVFSNDFSDISFSFFDYMLLKKRKRI